MWINDAYKVTIAEFGTSFLNTLDIRLYVNPIVLSDTVLPVAGVDEPADSGYAPLDLPFPSAPALVGHIALASGRIASFTFDNSPGGETVHGAFLTDPANADATVLAQEDPSPFAITVVGAVYIVDCFFQWQRIT